MVPGCYNRSNKDSYSGIKFYRLPTDKDTLRTWFNLTGRCVTEISVHSRIRSEHFINGKKMKDSIPEIFPWHHNKSVISPPPPPTQSHPPEHNIIPSPSNIVLQSIMSSTTPYTHLSETSTVLYPLSLSHSTINSSSILY